MDRWMDGMTEERATDRWMDCLYVRLFDRIGGQKIEYDKLLYPRPQTLTYTC